MRCEILITCDPFPHISHPTSIVLSVYRLQKVLVFEKGLTSLLLRMRAEGEKPITCHQGWLSGPGGGPGNGFLFGGDMDKIVQPSRPPPLSQLHSVGPQVLAVDLQLFHLSLIYEPRSPSGHYRAQQIGVPHGHGLLIHFLANFFKYAVLHSTNGCIDLRSHFAAGCGA